MTHARTICFVLINFEPLITRHSVETTVLFLVLLPLGEDVLVGYFRILFSHHEFQLFDIAEAVPLSLLINL